MALTRVEKVAKGAVKIVLDRQDKRNALNIELMEELNVHWTDVENDPKVRVVILEGAGPCFCSGLDLALANQRDRIEQSAEVLKTLLLNIYLSSKITIASVHGAAIAGGAGLMSVCDVILASQGTKIGLPELQRGLVPAIIAVFLRRKLPEGVLKELILLGRLLSAAEAKQIGWIHYAVDAIDHATHLQALVQQALKSAPLAVFHTKNLLESFHVRSVDHELKLADKVHRLSRESKEATEGIAAFFEKREPEWS